MSGTRTGLGLQDKYIFVYIISLKRCYLLNHLILKRGEDTVIARIPHIDVRNRELFFIRMLLLHVRGATSFENLRSVEDPETHDIIVHASFEEAAKALHLVDDDQEWVRCMREAAETRMPRQLRLLFATILVYCGPMNPVELWTEFRDSMIDDVQLRFVDIAIEEAHNLALVEIQKLLHSMGSSLSNFGIPDPLPIRNVHHLNWVNRNIDHIDFTSPESEILQREMCEDMRANLNLEQTEIFNLVEQSLDSGAPLCLYIPGSGGTGKTFLYRAICYLVRGRGMTIFATAWTGNAAALLEGGQTCHSRFGLPVPFNSEKTSRFAPTSPQGIELGGARVILGDEASIMPGCFLVELDRLLRDCTRSRVSFGGKIVLLSGDFRQTLPVCKRASRTEIVQQCLNQQDLFRQEFTEIGLTQNMRLEPGQEDYLDWLNDLGNGQLPRYDGLHPDLVLLPEDVMLHDRMVPNETGVLTRQAATERDLIDFVYESPFNVQASYTQSRAIICPLNTDTMLINEMVLQQLPGSYLIKCLLNSQAQVI